LACPSKGAEFYLIISRSPRLAALEMAEAADDFEALYDAVMRLRQLRHDGQSDVRQPTGQRRQPKREGSRSRRRRKR